MPLHPLANITIDDIPLRTQVLMDVEFLLRFTSTERPAICVYPNAPSHAHIQFVKKMFPLVEFYVFSADLGQSMTPYLDAEYDPSNPLITDTSSVFVDEGGYLVDTKGVRKCENLTITSLPLLTRDAMRFSQRAPSQDLVVIARHHDITHQLDLHKLTASDCTFLALSLMHVRSNTLQGEFVLPIHTNASESFVYQVVHRRACLWIYDFFQVRAELSFFHAVIRNHTQPNYDRDTESLVFQCYSHKFGFVPLPVIWREFDETFPFPPTKAVEDEQTRQVLDVLRVLQEAQVLQTIPE
jgi:hypothetical protein